ncbi:hypothetical protein [Sphingomonas sp.]|uniref:hypothetical protein n=1 Tax=Sphingomonas sp. TaxID=28214 RepID=UPI001B14CDBE|nr:hypothetical protein [Sphingomonas sp.]MBO9714342.1 hypothetical protein [Sphingomonas sp.]
MAIYGFRGLGWFGCAVAVALGSYMATSQGAGERARLAALDAGIAKAHKDIRDLETQFDARANMLQLGEWNGKVLGLNAPTASQYLPDEQALASLDAAPATTQPGAAPQQTAKLVVPGGIVAAPAVQTASVSRDDVESKTPRGTAQQGELKPKVRQAVAMLDDKTFEELKKRGEAELSALR